ncbi:sulfatase-like hydrolase/transferase [Nonomuraea phyllanthi]|uniref:Sulfatase-like hydrolase/transferase n=1 Tax=Nonomuraea phyllanthi TaxID=2219224 RepID=A0A5C4WPV1_9ACTN|nr:sulfatase [Nonomuraea phyllanthi]KAB8195436.1 sulfatase-like hydrolase/transferase [Nonomuraea phyllanthi]QFY10430.1 sulfatase-like hydrolase/transferase [Nonomuraea phyllanthi]
MNADLSRRALITGATATAALGALPARGAATTAGRPAPPNILLFTVDDMGGDSPGCFGGRPDLTPAIDRLAREGLAFRRAHVPVAICQPSRSATMTGRYPHRNGAEGFEPIRDDVPVLNDLLRPRGYLTGILGKVGHLAPVERFAWDLQITPPQLGMGRDPEQYARFAAELFERARTEGRPFFLMANAEDPHRPFHGSAAEQRRFTPEELATIATPSRVYTPAEAEVPGFLPDLPGVREEMAQYLSSARRADDTLAAVLAALDSSGLAGDTIVIFMSDNGQAVPYAKANCYEHSTRTPLIIRWPGVTGPGDADDHHFVSTMDLFPTLCRAAGAPVPDGLDGRDLTPLLEGGGQPGRGHVNTVFHESAGQTRYEMRGLHDGRWSYIWNAWSDGLLEYRAENMSGLTWPAMLADPAVAARVDFYLHRTPEELYDLHDDPHALRNLAGDTRPEIVAALDTRRAALDAWMRATGDPMHDQYPHAKKGSFS